MNTEIIKVSNLFCKYPNGRVVLEVEDFYLCKGETVFLLGPSGIGKSTFIEAVGLINNTAQKSNTAQLIYNLSSGEKVDMIDLWHGGTEKLESFRRDHFSFIFQNNYLMPNLTAGENMMLTLLMKGENESSAAKKIHDLMEVVRLSPDVMEKNIFNVSGGQKQRLAFVRAVASPFEILIGDEPTGNLDAITAHALMEFTRNQIVKGKKSGIFVSHDINLALKYSDRVYLFVPKKTEHGSIGHLSSSSLLLNKNGLWYHKENEIKKPEEFIRNAFEEII